MSDSDNGVAPDNFFGPSASSGMNRGQLIPGPPAPKAKNRGRSGTKQKTNMNSMKKQPGKAKLLQGQTSEDSDFVDPQKKGFFGFKDAIKADGYSN